MGRISKIEKLGLQETILKLMNSGIVTCAEIAGQLEVQGHKVSKAAVARWLKEYRESRREETGKIVREHVAKVVPADLDALEEMEAQCLAWAREETAGFSHRLAAQHVRGTAPAWLKSLRDLDAILVAGDEGDKEKARQGFVREIMQQCLGWIADELALQKRRVGAMRMASQIIDLKLRYAGIIDGAGAGSVFFVDKEQGDEIVQDEKSGRLFVIQGGGQQNG